MARSDLLGLNRIDNHMPNRGQVGWEGGRQIIAHAIDLKSLALPVKIMMVRDGRETGLGDEFGDGQTQGQIKGNRQCVLRDDDLQLKTPRKFI